MPGITLVNVVGTQPRGTALFAAGQSGHQGGDCTASEVYFGAFPQSHGSGGGTGAGAMVANPGHRLQPHVRITMVLIPELIARIQTIEGERPVAAPIPPPGIYWIKRTVTNVLSSYYVDEHGTRLDRVDNRYNVWIIHSWNNPVVSDWLIAQVTTDGEIEVIGDDCSSDWEERMCVTTHVSERVEPPPQ